MATHTAQILIGAPHLNKDGLIPSNYLFLSENSRPAWILVNENIYQDKKTKKSKLIWIPTVENMLEDGLLMIAVNVSKNKEILEMLKDYSIKTGSERLELYTELNDEQRDNLYQVCRGLTEFPKLIISVFRSSSIENQLGVLENYKMDVEVCTPSYSRLYSRWLEETRIEGSL